MPHCQTRGAFLKSMALTAPHGPFQVSDKYFDKYKARGLGDGPARSKPSNGIE